MNLPQNQCAFQTAYISSIGTPLVSGKKKYTNKVIMMTNPLKNRKRPNFKWQSMVRKHCPIMKVNVMLNITFKACPAGRVSKGKISLGTNQPKGPHDHAKAAT